MEEENVTFSTHGGCRKCKQKLSWKAWREENILKT